MKLFEVIVLLALLLGNSEGKCNIHKLRFLQLLIITKLWVEIRWRVAGIQMGGVPTA